MSEPVNQALHAVLTTLEQLASQARISELGLGRPIAELVDALTEQRLELVNVQAELRETVRMTALSRRRAAGDGRQAPGRQARDASDRRRRAAPTLDRRSNPR